MGRIIGIDLGTTNSVAAYWSRRRPRAILSQRFNSPLTPSVVALEGDQRIIGHDAKHRRFEGSEDVVYSIKRLIGRNYDDQEAQEALEFVSYQTRRAPSGEVEVDLGDHYYSPTDISAMILAQLKSNAEIELGEEVTHAVITVPAYFSQRQKNATREAGHLAGLSVTRIINEPTASALSFGIDENTSEPKYILVYDFGGGTFDISIIMVAGGNFEVLRIDGDNFLGGDNFDNLIQNKMFSQLKSQTGIDFRQDNTVKSILKGLAEQVKINLSLREQSQVARSGITITKEGAPVNLDFTLTREQYESMITPLVDKSIDLTLGALEKEGYKADEIDRVLLVGGVTRTPLIRQRLKDIFGERIELDVDPMLCVSLGAAIQTTIPIEWLCTECNTVNEGTRESCHSCKHPHEEEGVSPTIPCDACQSINRQGQLICWNCGEKIGAHIEFEDSDLDEDLSLIRIGDITSKNLAVEVIHQDTSSQDRELKIIVPKGTPFPTHDHLDHELYTNRKDQQFIHIPVYEIEEENVPVESWEHVGTIINSKIPSGTPTNTPVIVEIRIDGDGILTVASYLKRMKEDTLVQKSFEFAGKETHLSDEDENLLLWTGFVSETYLILITQEPLYKRYLEPDQIEQASRLAARGKAIADKKDQEGARQLQKEIWEFNSQIPAPLWDIFWASFMTFEAAIQLSERRQVEKTITDMDNAASRGDIDLANQYLETLRAQTDAMTDKIPSNLLKVVRG